MRLPTTKLTKTRTVAMTRPAVTRNHIDAQIRAQLGLPGRCPARDGLTRHVCCYDDSGSIVGHGGNDCLSRRYQETAIALDLLGRHCRCGRELVGVVHFDTGLLDVAPSPVGTASGLKAVHEALQIPPHAPGISTVGPALDVAEKFAVDEPLTTLVIASDFLLSDTGRVGELVDAKPTWVDYVHLVSLGQPPFVAQAEAPPWVTVTSLGAPGTDQTRQPGEVAKAMHASFTRTRRRSRRSR